MRKFVPKLQRRASGRTVLVLFLLTMASYLAMLLYTIPKVQSFAPGTALFDLSPAGYSYEHALSLLQSLGQEGRDVYLYQQIPLDLIYPGLFAVTYSLMLTWLFARRFEAHSRVFYLAIVPVLAGLFDYLENTTIVAMIMSFPDLPRGLVTAASAFTLLKSGFTTAFFVLLLVGFVFLLRRRPDRSVAG